MSRLSNEEEPGISFSVADIALSSDIERLTDALLATLDPLHIARAVRDFFVPRWADGVIITLIDERGEQGLESAGDFDASLADGSPIEFDLAEAGAARLYAIGDRTALLSRTAYATVLQRVGHALRHALAYERELRAARTFQNSALRSQLPSVTDIVFSALYEAGHADALVGGDWYDAFLTVDERVVLSIGDVLGSGLDAAVAMVNIRQAIRGVAHIYPDPGMMLSAAEHTVMTQYPDRFATTFVGVFDPATRYLSYANAGHPAPLVLDGSYVHALDRRDVPLGLRQISTPREVQQTVLPADAMLLLYTDGLIEADRDVIKGNIKLRAALSALDNLRDRQAARRIHDTVLGEGHARDDVALLTMFCGDSSATTQRWRYDPAWSDATQRVRSEMHARLEQLQMDRAAAQNFDFVFAELIGNAVRHAPGTVEVFLQHARDHVVLHLVDRGPGFEFHPRLPSNLFTEYGRGLFLVNAFCDHFVVERRPGGGSHARALLPLTTQENTYEDHDAR